ncbi:hypothetical protein Bache_2327 [Bacteroides helcogenes P 36-108]|uniref:Uncharacterized protein n=1 Tax=Bacteroides helcogenes (strain ATCC 35417 / DSM 20613 / JCM 6297 / CCUG 15421 / P 36-108) TaxID=693979 RepID=E6STP8_BACT6|nr:hypothetical protein Bache_2327 [Bacteroides helcogenes P 36-108]
MHKEIYTHLFPNYNLFYMAEVDEIPIIYAK